MTITTSNIVELGKAEFYTIEAFEFTFEDDWFYEGERCEDVDTYWFESVGGTLGEYVMDQCNNNLNEDDHVMVSIIPRRWATIENGIPTDYGDDCLGREDYIWNGYDLLTQEEYINEMKESF